MIRSIQFGRNLAWAATVAAIMLCSIHATHAETFSVNYSMHFEQDCAPICGATMPVGGSVFSTFELSSAALSIDGLHDVSATYSFPFEHYTDIVEVSVFARTVAGNVQDLLVNYRENHCSLNSIACRDTQTLAAELGTWRLIQAFEGFLSAPPTQHILSGTYSISPVPLPGAGLMFSVVLSVAFAKIPRKGRSAARLQFANGAIDDLDPNFRSDFPATQG